MIASIVNVGDLLHVIWVSLVAGIGVTAAYGFVIVGGTRAVDLGRAGRTGEALLFGVLFLAAAAVVIASIVFGIVGLVNK